MSRAINKKARLEGFEPPTLGSVGAFHDQHLERFAQNLAFRVKMFVYVHGCSTQ
jgi:hypothetical protein